MRSAQRVSKGSYFAVTSLGPYFELSIEFGRRLPDDELARAVEALWRVRGVQGPYPGPDRQQPLTRWVRPGRSAISRYYGTIEFDGATPFELVVTRSRTDAVTLSIPRRSVHGQTRPPGSLTARSARLEHILANVSSDLYLTASFAFAVVGELAAGMFSAELEAPDYLSREVIDTSGGFVLSDAVWQRLRPVSEPVLLPHGLRWYPGHRDAAGAPV